MHVLTAWPCGMRKAHARTLEGAHVVVIGRSRGISLAAARLARDAGAEVTIAGRSREKRIQG